MSAPDDAESLEWPLVATGALERREYQVELAESALTGHSLVCLPTGLGKTTVSLLVTARRLEDVGGRSLLLAPTKPLVSQHAAFYREALTVPDDEIVVFTGEVRPGDRADLWDEARVVVATPQVVENDLVGSRISLSSVTHLTFDECHRATGDYAYNFIADRYHAEADDALVTGMSASPGGDEEAILRVCDNLGIERVSVMTEDDADVGAHTHETSVEWEAVELPDAVAEIRDALHAVIRDRLEQLREVGVAQTTDPEVSEAAIQRMQGQLSELMDADQSEGYQGMSLLAEVRKLRTAVSYAETQSVESLRRYLDRQQEAARSSGASKADQRLASAPKVRRAMRLAREYDDVHPKFRRARMLIAETLGIEGGDRVIVFTESRDTAESLTAFLGQHFPTQRFVGQSDTDGSDGMTQREQQDVLDGFRAGEFDVLVSTSVAEEGLHVPEVDLVLFYEPVPTAIRSIQRKGRTGRQAEGRVVVLMAEDTRDEAYFWKSRQDESRMEEELQALRDVATTLEGQLTEPRDQAPPQVANGSGATGAQEADQAGLDAFAGDPSAAATDGVVASAGRDGDGVEIVVDQREMEASIARTLSRRDDVTTRLETLAVGDYVVSDRVVIERKSVADFLETLTGGDRSLFEQVGDANRHYARPVVVIEGEGLYGERNVHPKAIGGAIASLAVDFGASVVRTDDEDETAYLIEAIARREQAAANRDVSIHGEKQSKTLAEQQVYVVAAIAEVGPVIARALLSHFGSVEAVMTADEGELQDVEGVGAVTAERIRDVVASGYTP